MNRGSAEPFVGRGRRVGGFNEAPIHESGKFVNTALSEMGIESSFNEAPIHESGKLDLLRGRTSEPHRFNEAPIHESGKFHQPASVQAGGQAASMRPRFMNRGSHAPRLVLDRRVRGLQ